MGMIPTNFEWVLQELQRVCMKDILYVSVWEPQLDLNQKAPKAIQRVSYMTIRSALTNSVLNSWQEEPGTTITIQNDLSLDV